MKVRIKEDLFDISSRLKDVEREYFVLYDTKKKVYEIHNTMQKGNSFCFLVGRRLDYYAIQKAHKTSIKWLKSTLKNIDNHNNRLEERANKEISYKIRTNLKMELGLN